MPTKKLTKEECENKYGMSSHFAYEITDEKEYSLAIIPGFALIVEDLIKNERTINPNFDQFEEWIETNIVEKNKSLIFDLPYFKYKLIKNIDTGIFPLKNIENLYEYLYTITDFFNCNFEDLLKHGGLEEGIKRLFDLVIYCDGWSIKRDEMLKFFFYDVAQDITIEYLKLLSNFNWKNSLDYMAIIYNVYAILFAANNIKTNQDELLALMDYRMYSVRPNSTRFNYYPENDVRDLASEIFDLDDLKYVNLEDYDNIFRDKYNIGEQDDIVLTAYLLNIPVNLVIDIIDEQRMKYGNSEKDVLYSMLKIAFYRKTLEDDEVNFFEDIIKLEEKYKEIYFNIRKREINNTIKLFHARYADILSESDFSGYEFLVPYDLDELEYFHNFNNNYGNYIYNDKFQKIFMLDKFGIPIVEFYADYKSDIGINIFKSHNIIQNSTPKIDEIAENWLKQAQLKI